MSIWGCGSPAHCCQLAVAGGFIDYKVSPLQAHWGRWRYIAFSSQCVYLQFMWEVSLPPSPLTATFTSFPTPGCWVGAATPAFSGRLVYLQFRGGLPLPPSSALRAPHPLCYMFFLLLLLFIQFVFFLFFPWVGVIYPGGYADVAQGCLWEYCIPLSSPGGLLLPKWCGCWHPAVQDPSWFLRLTWSGDAMLRLRCGRVRVLPLLSGFSCKVYLQHLSEILF
jgi:hypothetical protein